MEYLIYKPRYFGPGAFPIPEIRENVAERFEIEVRGEYHYYSGDKTKDLFARVMIPVVKGKVAVEISAVVFEDFLLTPETRDERFAAAVEIDPLTYNGDIILSSFFQLLKDPEWADIMLSLNLKTASGGRLSHARFTDAATYWLDVKLGKELYRNEAGKASFSVHGLGGVYTWLTNSKANHQYNAFHYGIGFIAKLGNFTLQSDLSGIHGYDNDGDRPVVFRNNLTYEYKKNGLSLRYWHGMKDRLYETYTLGYIRYF